MANDIDPDLESSITVNLFSISMPRIFM